MNGINISSIKVIPLDKSIDVSSFHCKENELNSFLWESAEEYRQALLGTTHLLVYDEKVIGYFTLSMDSLKIQRIPDVDRIGFENIEYYPTIKIGQLAVDEDFERKGVGSYMLKIICGIAMNLINYVGCRFVAVNAIPTAQSWYEKQGFKPITDQSRRIKLVYYIDILKLS
jgi:GNAT superfamily N-acetyltransferase